MVTKNTTKKHKVFSTKLTKKNKYGGVANEPVAFSLTSKFVNVPTVEKPDYYSQKLNIVVEPKSEVSPEIIIPSIIDEDLFNKALASNVDVLIEKSLDMNDFSYFLEKQKLTELVKQKEEQKLTELVKQKEEQKEEEQQQHTTPYNIPNAFETSNGGPISVFGGSKYFENLDENPLTKWSNIFKKYRELIFLFSTLGTGHVRRTTEIDRFNLFLEMMSFYHDTKEVEFKIITDSEEILIDTLNEYYTAIPDADFNRQGIPQNFIDNFSKITINKKKVSEYFVRFVLFNNSINRLFVNDTRIIPQATPPSVKVNIFQMDESLTASTEYMERTLTDALPKPKIIWSDVVNQNNFFTQFTTNVWNQKYISDNFFKPTMNTGDNISVLVRSTILYVISKIFNNPVINAYINSTTIKDSKDLERKLIEAFPNVSRLFLNLIAENFFPISYEEEGEDKYDALGNIIEENKINNDSELIEQQQIVKNFLNSSRSKTAINEVALPYNIFFNLYKRDGSSKYLTNIPNNIINTEALAFVNDLELFLTLNKYLTDTTIDIIEEIQQLRDNITNTQNIYNTTNGINTESIDRITLSGHINPDINQRSSWIPAMLQRAPIQNPLRSGVIEANLHQEPLTVHESAFDFQSNLTYSLPIFDSSANSTPPRIIPEDCKLKTHIAYLDGSANATIDCQRACLMSQLVYEPSKVVRLFDFSGCWPHNETLVPPELPPVGKGLKYLCPYQPDYGYGKYTQDITAGGNPINRFNNTPYIKNDGRDNLDLMNYNYVEHRCHVWIDDNLKRVYVVFRGSISSHDWWYTDRTIAQGLGFQEGRLLQIKEILRDVYKKLNSFLGAEQEARRVAKAQGEDRPDPRTEYKLIFAGHSLGGFLSIMSAAVVFNNGIFNYPNTFQRATSITFNPWFPPETAGVQGVVGFYIPIINYGTTCALAFGICQDAAQRTLIPSCSTNANQFIGCTPFVKPEYYLGKVKGPFYYYLVKSWASSSLKNLIPCHSVNNFFGGDIQRRLLDFTTDYISLYNDLPENINKKYNYLDMLFPELNKPDNGRVCSIIPGSTKKPALDCGVNVRTNIVLGGDYRLPLSPDIIDAAGIITLVWSADNSKVTVTVNPNPSPLGGKKNKNVVKKTSKKIRRTRSKRTTKKLRK